VLDALSVVTIAVNLPGPVAAARLGEYGASVTKVEPPEGDPLEASAPAWYAELAAGHRVVRLDLKDAESRAELDRLLDHADVFITAQRPDALERLGLGWEALHARFPRLSQVAIVGYASPGSGRPGHDLNYVAAHGLVRPPELPRTLVADLGGAEAAVSAALAAVLRRERTGEGSFVEVALADAARRFASPLRHGLTADGGVLAGGYPGYALYETSDGWVSVAALEPRFRKRLGEELGLPELSHDALASRFREQSADAWERWAADRDLPVEKVPE
jgi:crotonobetainyl-CoA:carnitine CoA-transferase CaiB-like acyl-CoA transferase